LYVTALIVGLSEARFPVIQLNSQLLPVSPPSESDLKSGGLIFSGVGDDYMRAVSRLQEQEKDCLNSDGAGLRVNLQDGSNRLTVARDTIITTHPFPDCVKDDVEIVGGVFDKLRTVVNKLMRNQFGDKIDVVENGEKRKFDTLDSKTHLHLYSKSDKDGDDDLALPYHTDNGLYLFLTPSSQLPLLSVGRDGAVHKLDTGNNTVILLLGTGLTSWLLGDEGLYSPPHAVPSLPLNSLRTVMARMVVAPPTATLLHDPTADFWSHFSAPLQTEQGHTLARLRVQRSADCSQDWPHACSHGIWPGPEN